MKILTYIIAAAIGLAVSYLVVIPLIDHYTMEAHNSESDRLEIKTILKQRDSLQALYNESRLREQGYILQHEADSAKAQHQSEVIVLHEKSIKTYSQRLRENKGIKIKLDSFLIKRYSHKN